MLQRYLRITLLIGLLLPFSTPAFAQPHTLYVSMDGKDGVTCGDQQQPCRSIRRAIRNAHNGDTILVGPGRYGDVDRDGDFRDLGEEKAEVGVGCRCLIKIEKPLTIASLEGAAATVLNANDHVREVVRIQADNTNFGRIGKGFTVTRARGTGIVIAEHTKNIRVEGNIVKGNRGSGIRLNGSNNLLYSNAIQGNRKHGLFIAAAGTGHEVRRNVIIDNRGRGILTFANKIVIADNTIEGNDVVIGCGLVNNSKAALRVSGNIWGGTGKSSRGSVNTVCDLSGSRTIIAPSAKQESTTSQNSS